MIDKKFIVIHAGAGQDDDMTSQSDVISTLAHYLQKADESWLSLPHIFTVETINNRSINLSIETDKCILKNKHPITITPEIKFKLEYFIKLHNLLFVKG